jgi:hypothetical protein
LCGRPARVARPSECFRGPARLLCVDQLLPRCWPHPWRFSCELAGTLACACARRVCLAAQHMQPATLGWFFPSPLRSTATARPVASRPKTHERSHTPTPLTLHHHHT